MVKIKDGISINEKGDLFIRREFRKLGGYEQHLMKVTDAEEMEKKLAEKESREPRKQTIAETSTLEKINGKLDAMYQAFDDAVAIAPADMREYYRSKVRARLAYNEQPLFYEREDKMLEKCVERAKVFGMAYLVPGAEAALLEEGE